MILRLFASVFLIFIGLSAFGQNACDVYFPFTENAEYVMTNYNKKGKVEGNVHYKVVEVNNDVATLQAKISDAKGKEVVTTSYGVTCNNDGISIDFKSMMNPDMFKQYKDMDIDMSGTNVEFPKKLQVNQKLKEAQFIMKINMGAMNMTMTMDMVNRTVESKETVTTAAGTFECFLISYDSEVKMGMKQSYKIKEWISEGVGLIKTASYNKNGKLMTYSELTSRKI